MDLELGITGIRGGKGPLPEPPFTDLIAFRTHCFEVARIVGARLSRFEAPGDRRFCNFCLARMGERDSTPVVLVNVVRPIVAFAECPAARQFAFQFVDSAKLAEAFSSLGDYTIAPSSELNRPLLRKTCDKLSPAEIRFVRYFRPKRVGDVIFNYWD